MRGWWIVAALLVLSASASAAEFPSYDDQSDDADAVRWYACKNERNLYSGSEQVKICTELFVAADTKYDETVAKEIKAMALNGRALGYVREKDYDSAIADLSEGIRLDPTQTGLFILRGRIYQAKRDAARAQADFDAAKKLKPSLKLP